MLTQQDLKQLSQKGITQEKLESQLNSFKTGFPFLRLKGAAAVGNGIIAPDDEQHRKYVDAWNKYKAQGRVIVKFVPASGAASRMFKDMFAFLDAPYDVPCDKCRANNGKSIKELLAEGQYKTIVANMLRSEGLNYGQLPKGLLLFHNYENGPRTPMEEHLVEAALYAASDGKANVHFTVSHDHLELFRQRVAEKVDYFEKLYGVKFNISFSEQKPSTDTVAANPDNTPFRNEDGLPQRRRFDAFPSRRSRSTYREPQRD